MNSKVQRIQANSNIVIVPDNELSRDFGVVERPHTALAYIYNLDWVRRAFVVLALALIWEAYGRYVNNMLVFPPFSAALEAVIDGLWNKSLLGAIWQSIYMLLLGFSVGVLLAGAITMLAINTRIGNDFLATLTGMFSPLPAIALLPLALIWFGLGKASIIFILVHSVLWPVALNTYSGFQSVSPTMRMVGRNYGLRGFGFIAKILIPAAFPSILTGLKVGWAFAWRTLIAAEMVFGVSSGDGGLGWYIFLSKNVLDIPGVFGGLLLVIAVGLIVENGLFKTAEKYTVRRWNMQS